MIRKKILERLLHLEQLQYDLLLGDLRQSTALYSKEQSSLELLELLVAEADFCHLTGSPLAGLLVQNRSLFRSSLQQNLRGCQFRMSAQGEVVDKGRMELLTKQKLIKHLGYRLKETTEG